MSNPKMPRHLQGPCKGCTNRSKGDEPNCHNVDRCERWADFQRGLTEEKAKKREGCEARQYSRQRGRELSELHRKKDR